MSPDERKLLADCRVIVARAASVGPQREEATAVLARLDEVCAPPAGPTDWRPCPRVDCRAGAVWRRLEDGRELEAEPSYRAPSRWEWSVFADDRDAEPVFQGSEATLDDAKTAAERAAGVRV